MALAENVHSASFWSILKALLNQELMFIIRRTNIEFKTYGAISIMHHAFIIIKLKPLNK